MDITDGESRYSTISLKMQQILIEESIIKNKQLLKIHTNMTFFEEIMIFIYINISASLKI